MEYRNPDGSITTDLVESAKLWDAFTRPMEEILGAVVHSWDDRAMVVRFTDGKYNAGSVVFQLPVWAIRNIMKAKEDQDAIQAQKSAA